MAQKSTPEFSLVKNAHVKTDYSDQTKVTELINCLDNPLYFMRTFMKVQHPIKGTLPFEPYPFQVNMINAYHKHRFNVVMAARQSGKTICSAGFLLWKACFCPDSIILVTANKYVQALEIMSRIRFAYEELPDHIRPGVTKYNQGSIDFDNGSRLISRATSTDAGRGLSITLLYADELAFVAPNKSSEFMTSISPVLSTGGAAIITSTPRSDVDEFAKIWKGAIDVKKDEFGNPIPGQEVGSNGYFATLVPWYDHPERDEAWAEPFRQTLGEAKFKQEFLCEFVSDRETLIESVFLSRLKGSNPIFYTNTVRWYSDPLPNHGYLVALDPCVGTGRDYAAIQVFQLPELIQVAEWQHNKTDPRGQVRVLMQTLLYLDYTLRTYDEQNGEPELYWSFENNGLGESIIAIIEDTGEERFPGMLVNEKRRKGQVRRFRKGLNTSNRNKLSACARLKSLIESGRMKINSENLISEFKTYIALENSFKAISGSHDDLVAATLLIARMLDIVLSWGIDAADLRETIGDDELTEVEPLPMIC